MNPDTLLKPYERFGVHLGLERIQHLLANLGNPQHQVPTIHIAGSNGKGSVCAYLSSILTHAGYRVGRYISPHLIDWRERICLNEQQISEQELQKLLEEVLAAIQPGGELPTQFEVITAAAWLYFAKQKVDVAVVEVGLGGRLDATNVCARPLVSIITSISWEHWQVLGPTLAHIAAEKAGILKSGCPAVIGPLPPEAKAVVDKRIAEVGCPAIWPEPAKIIQTEREKIEKFPPACSWASYQGIVYPLPLAGEAQLVNSALALATVEILRQRGWKISDKAIAEGMAQTKWPGRIQWIKWRDHLLLIDGAHNSASATVLRQYVDSLNIENVTWVVGILASKDREGILKALLRSGERLYLVPVPDHKSAIPEELAELALQICPLLAECQCFTELLPALEKAIRNEKITVLCGSLYLIGHFLASTRQFL
ncbi:MAG: bifunctional folylpolyglutamate synthase/dihydrofolate synthase [Oscillatoriaceae bacterium SKW80]|nr:bifunctional folylpolyglutamate synthase/dihydrofolate synthase [Oscillatoriaceae bacterium SKYG93]MCX8122288.1 bifunctional folylpolyglutamate synthase/dihydrofolate synthase [Oscillatoriaceae bacterium SKW80]MDW8452503.1 folylpolyglutamate synthase/dihydrofolate synthase family protein [Oscillatoriaceae cyanobacterium SKYGB_i_bin93]HIK29651.1 bifunctional folylpolyglutamate synthase/dihydrofolate synthase [Oscillatoriaceae cyanobacterium M7585_C2015_266]